MTKQLTLVLCLLTFTTATANAEDCKPDSSKQGDMNICAFNAYKKADAEMNARYEKITACLKDEAKPLAQAQQVWLKFRDAECKFQVGPREGGGSMWPMAFGGCLRSVTEDRSRELNYYLTCHEGDRNCPTYACGFNKDQAAPN